MHANCNDKLLAHNYIRHRKSRKHHITVSSNQDRKTDLFVFFFFVLQYLSKIKILQLERDRGEWEGLAPDVRREKESSLQMFGQLGRFHNIMSNETIGTLAFLTSGQTQKFNSLGAVVTFS